MNEREALEQMQRGNITGLAVLVEQHQVRAVRAAMLITRDKALAEDVVQASFIKAYQKIHQFDLSKPFAAWFMRIVVNAAVEALRKQSRFISFNSALEDELDEADFMDLLADHSANEPEAVLEASEAQARVLAALEQLSPEQRAAVVMRYYLEMSEAEMASALETPNGTIKWRLHEAKRRLKGLLLSNSKTTQVEVKHG